MQQTQDRTRAAELNQLAAIRRIAKRPKTWVQLDPQTGLAVKSERDTIILYDEPKAEGLFSGCAYLRTTEPRHQHLVKRPISVQYVHLNGRDIMVRVCRNAHERLAFYEDMMRLVAEKLA